MAQREALQQLLEEACHADLESQLKLIGELGELVAYRIIRTKYSYRAHIKIHSTEICARIVGRGGEVVVMIAGETSTKITSPQIRAHKSNQTFVIESHSLESVVKALGVICKFAKFFATVIEQRSQVKPGEVSEDVPVSLKAHAELLKQQAKFIVLLRERLGVNIVSPKNYSNDLKFTIIGQRHTVDFAWMLMTNFIKNVDKL